MVTESFKGVIPNIEFSSGGVTIQLGMLKPQYHPINTAILGIDENEKNLPGRLNMASALRNAYINKMPVTLRLEFSFYMPINVPGNPGVPSQISPNFWAITHVSWSEQ
jgi:hypothetical protein